MLAEASIQRSTRGGFARLLDPRLREGDYPELDREGAGQQNHLRQAGAFLFLMLIVIVFHPNEALSFGVEQTAKGGSPSQLQVVFNIVSSVSIFDPSHTRL